MSEAIQNAIAMLETELEAIDQKRGDIEHAIGSLQRLVAEGLTPNGRGRQVSKRAHSMRGKGQTDRPAKRATGAGQVKPASNGPDEKGERILAALRKAGGVMKPGALAKACGYASSPALWYHAKALLKGKLIAVEGHGGGRRIRLPGKLTAKEVP